MTLRARDIDWDPTMPDESSVELISLSEVKAEQVEWLWPGRLARGKYTLVAGDPGLGKSTLALDVAARLSRGSEWPDGGLATVGRTLILTAEDGLADTIRPRLDKLGADSSHVMALTAVCGNGRDEWRPFNLETDVERLRECIRGRSRPDLVIIDPVSAYLGRVDTHRDAPVRRVLAPLMALIEQEHVALLAIAHLNKDQQRTALHRPGGSVAFVAAARIALCLAADPHDEDRRVLASLKNNLAPKPPSLAFRLPEGRLTWEPGVVDLDVEALLAKPVDREDQTDADAVLDDLLAEEQLWPLDATAALVTAEAQGVHPRTLRRAAKRRGIRIRRDGFGPGGKFVWHRPAIADTPGALSPTLSPMASMAERSEKRSIDPIGDNKSPIDDVSSMQPSSPRRPDPLTADGQPFSFDPSTAFRDSDDSETK